MAADAEFGSGNRCFSTKHHRDQQNADHRSDNKRTGLP
jgi:hypothetical protein